MDIQFKSKAFDEYGGIEEGLRKEGIDWTADAQELGEDDDYTGETPITTEPMDECQTGFGQYFLKKYSHLFIYNTLSGELAYYNEKTKLWELDTKLKRMSHSRIYVMLSDNIRRYFEP